MDTNRTSSPPTWLTAFLQDREPEYLIRTCLRYHMVLPAIDYTLSMIQKVSLIFLAKPFIICPANLGSPYFPGVGWSFSSRPFFFLF